MKVNVVNGGLVTPDTASSINESELKWIESEIESEIEIEREFEREFVSMKVNVVNGAGLASPDITASRS